MTAVLRKYWPAFAVLGLITAIGLTWLILSGYNSNKVPSRGVFVLNFNENAVTEIDEKYYYKPS